MNQQPAPPTQNQSIYPTPQEQGPSQNQSVDQNQSPKPNKDNTLKIVLIAFGLCFVLFIIIFALLGGMTFLGLNSARDRAKDARIQSIISSEQAAAEMYYDTKNTYVGFQIFPE